MFVDQKCYLEVYCCKPGMQLSLFFNVQIPPIQDFLTSSNIFSRRGVWMLVHRLAGLPPPLMRRPKSSTIRPQRSLADLPSGGRSAHTWRVWLRCSRRAPVSAYQRKSCSTKGLIGCCPLAACQSSILPWAFCRSSLPSSGETAGVNTHQLPGISYFFSVSLVLFFH